MKNIQIPKLSDFGTSKKPPNLILGKPQKNIEWINFGIRLFGNNSEIPRKGLISESEKPPKWLKHNI